MDSCTEVSIIRHVNIGGYLHVSKEVRSVSTRKGTGICEVAHLGFIEGSLEVKLPTIWTVEKHSQEETRTWRKSEGRRKSQKREDAGARKGRKVAKHCVFPMFCGSGGSKSRLAKAAGAEVAGQMKDAKLHPVVARSTF